MKHMSRKVHNQVHRFLGILASVQSNESIRLVTYIIHIPLSDGEKHFIYIALYRLFHFCQ